MQGYVSHETAAPSASIPKTFPSDQRVDPNPVALRCLALPGVAWRCLALPESGAGDGNRTHAERAFEPLKQAVWENADAKCD